MTVGVGLVPFVDDNGFHDKRAVAVVLEDLGNLGVGVVPDVKRFRAGVVPGSLQNRVANAGGADGLVPIGTADDLDGESGFGVLLCVAHVVHLFCASANDLP